jgi:hypothetical protein
MVASCWSDEHSKTPNRRRIRARVGGLHVSLCTGTIERAVGRQPGGRLWRTARSPCAPNGMNSRCSWRRCVRRRGGLPPPVKKEVTSDCRVTQVNVGRPAGVSLLLSQRCTASEADTASIGNPLRDPLDAENRDSPMQPTATRSHRAIALSAFSESRYALGLWYSAPFGR